LITKTQVSYIAPNKWFATDYGEGLRRLVAQGKSLSRVVDFRDFQVFSDATNYTCILSLSSKPRQYFSYIDASSGRIENEQSISAQTLSTAGAVWSFATGREAELLERLLGGTYPRLQEFRDRAFQGLRTSDNDVYVLTTVEPPSARLVRVTSRATGRVTKSRREF
jgi:Eco57I restriction-modification methylase